METTISLAKEHGLAALTLLAVLYVAVNTNDLRGQMAEGHRSILAEMAEGHQAIRAVMAEGDQTPRTGMTREFRSFRAEMAADHQAIRADISALDERVARVETRVGGIEERLERDLPRGE